MKTYYIGLCVTYHDPSIAILDEDGSVLFAEATERYLQHKRALNCPPDALIRIQDLLQQYCVDCQEFVIAINWHRKRPLYEKILAFMGNLKAPGLLKKGIKKLRSPLPNYQLHHMIACQRQHIQASALNLTRIIAERYPDCRIRFHDFPHHLTHAASACYSSPFSSAACAIIDSFGEKGALAFFRYDAPHIQPLFESKGPGSLGFYYMKITELCGFDWLKGEEWKVMGLAPYGQLDEDFYALLKQTIRVDGYRCLHQGRHLFQHLEKLQRFQCRDNTPIEQAANLAFTGQLFFAELMTTVLQHLQQETGEKQLILAGGCALNSAFNGQIRQRTAFDQIFIPSAPADDGTALGAAWLALKADYPERIQITSDNKPLSPYSGSCISDASIEKFCRYQRGLKVQHLPDSICQVSAERLAQGQLIGWIQGRAEFGPRALGNRSILADPRSAGMKDKINQQVKFREPFRPFAPSVLAEYVDDFFLDAQPSPYMDKTLKVKNGQRAKIAAVCHVDGSARRQTVSQEYNPRFHQLIQCFYHLTGIPMLLNTSFNIMGKPLVHSLEDALSVLMTSGLDAIVVNDYLIAKPEDDSR
jgi:carbamoyltransferase